MILDYKYFRPVRVAGIIFIILSAIGGLMYISLLNNSSLDTSHHVFIIINMLWYLLTGLGILLQRIWGYYLLKIYIYILILGFPIGTYFVVKSLRYLRKYEIKNYFARQALDI